MSIAPIRHSVAVKLPPARAFAIFTRDIGRWWPKGKTIGPAPHAQVVIEPHPGGRWYELAEDGRQTEWGRVLAWEPPGRLLLAWQIDAGWLYDPAFSTELELTFVPHGAGALVSLEHRQLERYGDSAAKHAAQLNGGWPTLLRGYARVADAEPSTETNNEGVRP